MAPQYKLYYFDMRAFAEPCRLLFAHATIKYEDIRVEPSEWPQLKSKMPWGKMPVLEVEDGDLKFKLAQSVAILHYLAKKYNYAGANGEEDAFCLELVTSMVDLRDSMIAWHREPDAEKKAVSEKELNEVTFPFYLGRFSKILEKNGGTYLVGESLTYADLHIAHTIQTSISVTPDFLKGYPALEKHQRTVFELPGIKEWVATRPVTQW